jgi:pyrimidine-nucleoside phosphorylase
MSAFLMAAFLNGMSQGETDVLVDAMLHSGNVLDFSGIQGKKVDKHSTGGVGDKISLILAPLAACLGVKVPMISGRGLGHSGGTLDKLESITGFRTDQSAADMHRLLSEIGVGMMGQTADIAPADRKLYALRDVTATVEFIPFIAASIMSKKLAEGLDGLVLDVKVGGGAFMKTEDQARALAEALADVGNRHGCRTVAVMTGMDEPLGRAIGNWLEVAESVDVLRGEGPEDVFELSCALAGEMLVLADLAATPAEGTAKAKEAVLDGRAHERFLAMVSAQGGDTTLLASPWEREGTAPVCPVLAAQAGVVQAIDAYRLGVTSVRMGAGRATKDDLIDPFAGITLNKKVGDSVGAGEALAWLHGSNPATIAQWTDDVRQAFELGSGAASPGLLFRGRYAEGGWTSA